jgi:hypothetical protein
MGIEVRCACGQLVTAEDRYAGQHVQCPHCKSSVAVPVAAATAIPPPTPERTYWDTADGKQLSLIAGFVAMILILGYIRGCREDAEKNRPSMKEILQKAHEKNR